MAGSLATVAFRLRLVSVSASSETRGPRCLRSPQTSRSGSWRSNGTDIAAWLYDESGALPLVGPGSQAERRAVSLRLSAHTSGRWSVRHDVQAPRLGLVEGNSES